jgi:hypothetical protein
MNSYRDTCVKALVALEAMPHKVLINNFYKKDGCMCAIGALANHVGALGSFDWLPQNKSNDPSITDFLLDKSGISIPNFDGLNVDALADIQTINDRYSGRISTTAKEFRYKIVVASLREFTSNQTYQVLPELYDNDWIQNKISKIESSPL